MEKAIYSKDGKRVINLKARETFKTENVSFEWDDKPKKKKKKRKSKGQQVVIDSIDLDEQSIVHGVMEAKMKAEKLARLKKSVNDTFPPSPASGLSPSMERQTIKYFWLSLTSEQRKELVQVEKEAVLSKMKRQQKNSCECDVCGRKREAIESELEVLYADYYKELDALAESTDLPLLPLPSMGFFQADDVLRGGHQDSNGDVGGDGYEGPGSIRGHADFAEVGGSIPGSSGRIEELEDDDELVEATRGLSLDNAESRDLSRDLNDLARSRDVLPPPQEQLRRPLPSNIGKEIDEEDDTEEDEPYFEDVKSLDVSSVADDLLTNDGKKFIEMMERLAEKRAEREEEYNDSDYSDYSSEYSADLTADQRMEEGRRMFQIFAARMFEQRVLHAYKQSVAAQVKAELQQMEEEKKTLDLEKEAREQQRRERKKEKKRLQKAVKDEERKKAQAEKEERERKEKEEKEKERLEAERKQQEKEREKEKRRAASEAKQKARKEEEARLAREKEEKRLKRIHEMEERMRLAKEEEERLKEEQRQKEREEEEKLEQERLEKERLEQEKIEQEREKQRLEEEEERKRLEEERQRQKLEEEREKRASMSIPMSKPLPGKSQISQPTSLGGLNTLNQPGTSLGGLNQSGQQSQPGSSIQSPIPQAAVPQPTPVHQAPSQILLDRLTPDPTRTPERHTPSPGSSTSNAKSLLDSLLRPAQSTPSTPGTPRTPIGAVGAIGTIGSPGQSHVAPNHATPSHVTQTHTPTQFAASQAYAPGTQSFSSVGSIGAGSGSIGAPGQGSGSIAGSIGTAGSFAPGSSSVSGPACFGPGAISGQAPAAGSPRFDPWNSSYSGIASSRLWNTSEVPGNVIRQAALDAYEELYRNGAIDVNGFVNSRALQNTAQKYSGGQGFGVSELFKACQGSFDVVGGLMKPRGGL
ncbi:Stress response protein [Yarrowia sp. B02]|nr:Stress response protein [Yarrowia sp. B02]